MPATSIRDESARFTINYLNKIMSKNLFKGKALVFILVLVVLILIGAYMMSQNQTKGKKVFIETTMGKIVIELDSNMPITAGNFEKLVSEGFYDRTIFHRVISGFMIQGGDPQGTGMGGPGYTIKDEFKQGNKNNWGTISMANSGMNTGGSQFFINLVDNNFLDTKHPVFGKVVEGMEIVDAIALVDTDRNDRPLEEVRIISAKMVG